jgi:hypothetical protein
MINIILFHMYFVFCHFQINKKNVKSKPEGLGVHEEETRLLRIGTRSSPSAVKMRVAAGKKRELPQLIQSGREGKLAEESTERHQPIQSGSGEETAVAEEVVAPSSCLERMKS